MLRPGQKAAPVQFTVHKDNFSVRHTNMFPPKPALYDSFSYVTCDQSKHGTIQILMPCGWPLKLFNWSTQRSSWCGCCSQKIHTQDGKSCHMNVHSATHIKRSTGVATQYIQMFTKVVRQAGSSVHQQHTVNIQ